MRRASHAAGELFPPPGPRSVVLVVDGPLTAGSVGSLCGRLHDVLQTTGADLVTCDVARLTHPSAADVDAVARLQLTARRLGRSIRLRHASGLLRELLSLFGLQEVVPCVPGAPPPEAPR
jgi:ABC-type transporter Mla MlaB component